MVPFATTVVAPVVVVGADVVATDPAVDDGGIVLDVDGVEAGVGSAAVVPVLAIGGIESG